jgi:hypothetical protein
LQSTLPYYHQVATTAAFTFQFGITVFGVLNLCEARTDNTGIQRQDCPVRQTDIVEAEAQLSPASQPTGAPNFGNRGANFAPARNRHHITGHELVRSSKKCTVTFPA